MLYFTSDTHFGHRNVIDLDNRPFETTDDMDEALVRNWNAKVRPCDTVWHLGDFFWYADPDYVTGIVERLNGEIRLVLGNHDGRLSKMLRNGKLPRSVEKRFAFVGDYEEVRSEGIRFRLSHYPIPCYNGRHHTRDDENKSIFMLHGHVHMTEEHRMMRRFAYGQEPAMQLVNVGCMLWGYAPVSVDQIKAACARPCDVSSPFECASRWGRGVDECEGCAFGSYWHEGPFGEYKARPMWMAELPPANFYGDERF